MASSPISPAPSIGPDAGVAAVTCGARRAADGIAAGSVPSPPPQAAAVGNPSIRLDPGLGLVVIEFHTQAGAVSESIPTRQQLQAYRRWEDARVGPPDQAASPAIAGDTASVAAALRPPAAAPVPTPAAVTPPALPGGGAWGDGTGPGPAGGPGGKALRSTPS